MDHIFGHIVLFYCLLVLLAVPSYKAEEAIGCYHNNTFCDHVPVSCISPATIEVIAVTWYTRPNCTAGDFSTCLYCCDFVTSDTAYPVTLADIADIYPTCANLATCEPFSGLTPPFSNGYLYLEYECQTPTTSTPTSIKLTRTVESPVDDGTVKIPVWTVCLIAFAVIAIVTGLIIFCICRWICSKRDGSIDPTKDAEIQPIKNDLNNENTYIEPNFENFLASSTHTIQKSANGKIPNIQAQTIRDIAQPSDCIDRHKFVTENDQKYDKSTWRYTQSFQNEEGKWESGRLDCTLNEATRSDSLTNSVSFSGNRHRPCKTNCTYKRKDQDSDSTRDEDKRNDIAVETNIQSSSNDVFTSTNKNVTSSLSESEKYPSFESDLDTTIATSGISKMITDDEDSSSNSFESAVKRRTSKQLRNTFGGMDGHEQRPDEHEDTNKDNATYMYLGTCNAATTQQTEHIQMPMFKCEEEVNIGSISHTMVPLITKEPPEECPEKNDDLVHSESESSVDDKLKKDYQTSIPGPNEVPFSMPISKESPLATSSFRSNAHNIKLSKAIKPEQDEKQNGNEHQFHQNEDSVVRCDCIEHNKAPSNNSLNRSFSVNEVDEIAKHGKYKIESRRRKRKFQSLREPRRHSVFGFISKHDITPMKGILKTSRSISAASEQRTDPFESNTTTPNITCFLQEADTTIKTGPLEMETDLDNYGQSMSRRSNSVPFSVSSGDCNTSPLLNLTQPRCIPAITTQTQTKTEHPTDMQMREGSRSTSLYSDVAIISSNLERPKSFENIDNVNNAGSESEKEQLLVEPEVDDLSNRRNQSTKMKLLRLKRKQNVLPKVQLDDIYDKDYPQCKPTPTIISDRDFEEDDKKSNNSDVHQLGKFYQLAPMLNGNQLFDERSLVRTPIYTHADSESVGSPEKIDTILSQEQVNINGTDSQSIQYTSNRQNKENVTQNDGNTNATDWMRDTVFSLLNFCGGIESSTQLSTAMVREKTVIMEKSVDNTADSQHISQEPVKPAVDNFFHKSQLKSSQMPNNNSPPETTNTEEYEMKSERATSPVPETYDTSMPIELRQNRSVHTTGHKTESTTETVRQTGPDTPDCDYDSATEYKTHERLIDMQEVDEASHKSFPNSSLDADANEDKLKSQLWEQGGRLKKLETCHDRQAVVWIYSNTPERPNTNVIADNDNKQQSLEPQREDEFVNFGDAASFTLYSEKGTVRPDTVTVDNLQHENQIQFGPVSTSSRMWESESRDTVVECRTKLKNKPQSGNILTDEKTTRERIINSPAFLSEQQDNDNFAANSEMEFEFGSQNTNITHAFVPQFKRETNEKTHQIEMENYFLPVKFAVRPSHPPQNVSITAAKVDERYNRESVVHQDKDEKELSKHFQQYAAKTAQQIKRNPEYLSQSRLTHTQSKTPDILERSKRFPVQPRRAKTPTASLTHETSDRSYIVSVDSFFDNSQQQNFSRNADTESFSTNLIDTFKQGMSRPKTLTGSEQNSDRRQVPPGKQVTSKVSYRRSGRGQSVLESTLLSRRPKTPNKFSVIVGERTHCPRERPKSALSTGTPGERPTSAMSVRTSDERPKYAMSLITPAERPKSARSIITPSEKTKSTMSVITQEERPKSAMSVITPTERPQSAMSGERPKSVMSVRTSSERPKSAMSVRTSGERPKSAMSVRTSGEKPKSAMFVGTSGEKPKSAISVRTSSERPKSAMSVRTSSERPKSAISVRTSSEKPKSAMSVRTSSERPKSAMSMRTSSERPKSAISVRTSSERSKSAMSVRTSSERPKSAMSVRTSGERPKSAMSVRTSGERPKSAMSVRTSGERPKSAMSVRTSGERPKSAMSVRTSGERPKSAMSVRTLSERPKSAMSARTSGERPKSAMSVRTLSERPKSAMPVTTPGEWPNSAIPIRTSCERPNFAMFARTPAERPKYAKSSRPPAFKWDSVSNDFNLRKSGVAKNTWLTRSKSLQEPSSSIKTGYSFQQYPSSTSGRTTDITTISSLSPSKKITEQHLPYLHLPDGDVEINDLGSDNGNSGTYDSDEAVKEPDTISFKV